MLSEEIITPFLFCLAASVSVCCQCSLGRTLKITIRVSLASAVQHRISFQSALLALQAFWLWSCKCILVFTQKHHYLRYISSWYPGWSESCLTAQYTTFHLTARYFKWPSDHCNNKPQSGFICTWPCDVVTLCNVMSHLFGDLKRKHFGIESFNDKTKRISFKDCFVSAEKRKNKKD